MEKINWHFIVETAISRRKEIKMTQERLAELTGLSTPTIIRFESHNHDITMSSVNKILCALGLMEKEGGSS